MLGIPSEEKVRSVASDAFDIGKRCAIGVGSDMSRPAQVIHFLFTVCRLRSSVTNCQKASASAPRR